MLLASIAYNKADKDEVERCRQASATLAETLLDMGALIFKAPPWAAEKCFKEHQPSKCF
jgi:hypothetical protein